MPTPQQRPQSNRYASAQRRRKKQRKKTLMGIVVLMVMVALIFGAAMLLAGTAGGGNPASAPSEGQTDDIPQPNPVSQQPSVAEYDPTPDTNTQQPEVVEFDTEYYEAELPPLFNYNHPIPNDYSVDDLVSIGNGHTMKPRAAAAFAAMQTAAAADGITLTPISGYRTTERQTNNYNRAIENYKAQGYSEEEAIRRTQLYYAIPGTSEHEAGLAVDINSLEETFENTEAFAWLQQHCTDYGFILRYHRDTTDITRIAYEPWHYRYVGSNHAGVITSQNVPLETYLEAD